MVKGLDRAAEAQVLLRIGSLAAGWAARIKRGSQETAKNLITQSIRIFEESGQI